MEAVLPEPLAAWVCAITGPGARVRYAHPLTGGTQATMHVVGVVGPTGSVEAVLRQYRPDEQRFAAREVLALRALGGLDGLVPVLLEADLSGPVGRPTLLLSRQPGRPGLAPADRHGWAAGLAAALARLHGVPTRALAAIPNLLDELQPTLGTGVSAVLAAGWPCLAAQPRVLTHGDYWTGNVLWDAGRPTGVVDWASASLTPRGSDVGNCRLDLWLLFGDDTGDAFLDAYQRAAGVDVPALALWDLLAGVRAATEHWLAGWLRAYHAFGRTDLDAPTLATRLDRWIARAGRRATG